MPTGPGRSLPLPAFELLRPAQGHRYLVYTRWRSQQDFESWMRSTYFQEGHKQHHGGPVSSRSEVWTFQVLEGEYAR